MCYSSSLGFVVHLGWLQKWVAYRYLLSPLVPNTENEGHLMHQVELTVLLRIIQTSKLFIVYAVDWMVVENI